MLTSDKPYTFDSVVRMILGAGFVIGLIWLMGILSSALVPFVAALLLAYLLNPLTSLIEKYVKNRSLAVGITLLGLMGSIIGIIWIVVPMMTKEFLETGSVLKELATNPELLGRLKEYLPHGVWEWVKDFIESAELQEFFSDEGMTKLQTAITAKAVPSLGGFAMKALSFFAGVLSLAVVILYVIFLLTDFGKIKEGWQKYLPANYRTQIVEFLCEFERTMSLYFRGQVSIALLVGVMLSIGFSIIDLPLAIMLGMLIGILNIAPYLGAAGIIPAVFFAAVDALKMGDSPLASIGLVLLVFGVVQAIQEVVLIPKIQGKSLGLSPWLILLSLSIWGQLLGILGLLIALPTTCLCLSYYRRLLAQREAKMEESS